uniref:Uncharacterized protein n=1 Tax=Romanomermis culicivorax TaxID=13658 RepID=A0A915IGH0_ROMCU
MEPQLSMAAKISLRLSKYTRSESQLPLRKFKCTESGVKLSMISGSTSDQYKMCAQSCEPPCQDYFIVETSTSLATYGSTSDRALKSVAAILKARGEKMGQFREEQLRNMISLDMYFDVLEINVINTQETTPLNNFIGNLGGQLGRIVCRSVCSHHCTIPLLFDIVDVLYKKDEKVEQCQSPTYCSVFHMIVSKIPVWKRNSNCNVLLCIPQSLDFRVF